MVVDKNLSFRVRWPFLCAIDLRFKQLVRELNRDGKKMKRPGRRKKRHFSGWAVSLRNRSASLKSTDVGGGLHLTGPDCVQVDDHKKLGGVFSHCP